VGKRKVVLCVDDEPNVLTTHKLILESAGYSVLTAATGKEGVAIFASHNVDAVLLDYRLPDVDGGAVAAQMKRNKPAIPLLMLSAQPSAPENAAGWIDSFIIKGEATPQAWLNAIAELL
jgi:CheY-like chemotaxis protein